jgi:hypothetical protein
VELQGVTKDLDARGIALFAISYDAVETLATFAAKYDITYPLLADSGSRVIRQLDMLDEDLERHHAEFGRPVADDQRGVAYPGVFLLDREGIVVRKRLLPNYRRRDTGPGLLEELLGVPSAAHGPEQVADGEVVAVRAYLDSPTYRWHQQLHLILEVTVAPGWHVYGTPIPDGYVPLGVEVEPIAGLEIGTPSWPTPHPFRLEGLDEEFWVHEGTVRGSVPLTLTADPGAGDVTIRARVRYQACSETTCHPPFAVRFDLPVREVALIERTLPKRDPPSS